MFKITNQDENHFCIQSSEDTRIIPTLMFDKVWQRTKRQSIIRNPVRVIINNNLFIFTRNEWKKCKSLAIEYKQKFKSEIINLYRMDLEDARQKSPTIMKTREIRAKVNADSAGYIRNLSVSSGKYSQLNA